MPDAIAEELEDLSAYGMPKEASYCPMARRLKIVDDFNHDLVVHANFIEIDGKRFELPDNVQRFVELFDRHYYPTLIETRGQRD